MENFKPTNNPETNLKENSPEITNENIDKNYSEVTLSFETLTPYISQTELLNLAKTHPELENPVNSFLASAKEYTANFWENYQAEISNAARNSDLVSETSSIATLTANMKEIIKTLKTKDTDTFQETHHNWTSSFLDNNGEISEKACGTLAIVLEYQKYLDKREADENQIANVKIVA